MFSFIPGIAKAAQITSLVCSGSKSFGNAAHMAPIAFRKSWLAGRGSPRCRALLKKSDTKSTK